jgi:hypothetical protein
VGIVLKTNGTICQGLLVSAIGRTNDVPWPLYVDVANSKVGIGTTNPTEKLHVNGTARVNKLIGNFTPFDIYAEYTNRGRITLFSSSSGADSTLHMAFLTNGSIRMVLNRGGNVGIGTTNPAHKLDVSGAIGLNGYSTIYSPNSGDDIYGNIRVLRNLHRTDGMYIGYDNAGGSNGHLRFYANGQTERMRIDASTGNVGIGTTSPATKLTIAQSADSNGIEVIGFDDRSTDNIKMHINSSGSGEFLSSNGLRFNSVSGQVSFLYNSNLMMQIASTSVNIRDNIELAFGDDKDYSIGYNTADDTFRIVDGSNLSSNPRLIIASDGNVGIGTTSPSEKLDVVGNIKASGTIKGKMEQMFACSFSDDLGTTKHYLSFTSNAEQTNVHADQAAMVMPYGGRVKCIQMRLSNIDGDTTRTFGVETIATGINMYAASNNWTIEETEAYELSADDDFYLVNYVFSNETHFQSGDLLAISIQDTEDAYTASRQTYVNVIIEYDLNNGMGNDTATTKYTS